MAAMLLLFLVSLAEQKVSKQQLIKVSLPWLYIYDASQHSVSVFSHRGPLK